MKDKNLVFSASSHNACKIQRSYAGSISPHCEFGPTDSGRFMKYILHARKCATSGTHPALKETDRGVMEWSQLS